MVGHVFFSLSQCNKKNSPTTTLLIKCRYEFTSYVRVSIFLRLIKHAYPRTYHSHGFEALCTLGTKRTSHTGNGQCNHWVPPPRSTQSSTWSDTTRYSNMYNQTLRLGVYIEFHSIDMLRVHIFKYILISTHI